MRIEPGPLCWQTSALATQPPWLHSVEHDRKMLGIIRENRKRRQENIIIFLIPFLASFLKLSCVVKSGQVSGCGNLLQAVTIFCKAILLLIKSSQIPAGTSFQSYFVTIFSCQNCTYTYITNYTYIHNQCKQTLLRHIC